MDETRRWTLEATAGGWVRCTRADGERIAYLQLKPSEKNPTQLRTYAAHMASDKPISGHTWAQVPFADIEQQLSLFLQGGLLPLTDPQEGDSPLTMGFEQYFAAHPEAQLRPFVLDLGAPSVPGEQPPPLQRPQRITDAFLKDVAAQYKWVSANGELPGPAMAEQTGAPVRTVQRWVYEARKRGFLPPGSPGRAG